MNTYCYNEPILPSVYSTSIVTATTGEYEFSSSLDESIYSDWHCFANNAQNFEDSILLQSTTTYTPFPYEISCLPSPQSYSTQSPLDMPYPLGENMADYFNVESSIQTKVELYNNNYHQHEQAGRLDAYPLIQHSMPDAIEVEQEPIYDTQIKTTSLKRKENLVIDTTNTINTGNMKTMKKITRVKVQCKQPKKTSNCTPKEEPKKVHACSYCHRFFARKYDVSRHKRIHTGSKPYACPCCPKSFARSDARVRHFRAETACRDGADKLHRIRKND